MQIIPEPIPSVVLTIPFVVTMLALWFILFKPLLDYIEERESVSHKALSEANRLRHDSEKRMTEIEARLADAQKAAGELRAVARARAQKEEAAIIREARGRSDQHVDAAVSRISSERDVASAALKGQAHELAHDLARAILGREL